LYIMPGPISLPRGDAAGGAVFGSGVVWANVKGALTPIAIAVMVAAIVSFFI